MAAIKQIRGGANGPKPFDTGRKRKWASPLDKAKGNELDWRHVAPVFEAVRGGEDLCFVYFIGEENEGPVKIGVAKCPITRLRTMQTGNPRRLKVERLLIGDRELERLLHELWIKDAIPSPTRAKKLDTSHGYSLPGTEWFRPEIRGRLFPIIETAAERQVVYVDVAADGDLRPVQLEAIVLSAHSEHGIQPVIREKPLFLAPTGGKH